MEMLSYSDRGGTRFEFEPKEANISKLSDDPLTSLSVKDYFDDDDVNSTAEGKTLEIGDKESRLLEAVWKDDSSRLVSLAKGGSDETLDPGVASRLLQLACRLDSVECARVLIDGDTGATVRINEMDGSGWSPLQTAAAMHSTKCIDLLLRKNARTDLRSKDGDSLLALDVALSSKRMKVDWSPKESVQELLVLLRERDLSAIRLLALATKDVAEVACSKAMDGRVVELAALLLVAADMIINAPRCSNGEGGLSSKKSRMMYEAVVEEAMALFEMEKRAQGDGNLAKYGRGSVQVYQKRRRLLLHEIELIPMFGEVAPVAGDNCKKRKALPPLLQAVQIGDESVAKLLLQAGADTDETDANGNSVLHLCLRAGPFSQNLRLFWLLLKHGVRVSQRNRLGLTPVHVAAEKGNYQALQILLLQAPECVNIASVTKETPLFFAVRNGFLDCTKLLLQYGADCQAINLRRQKPIDLASSQNIRIILNPANQGFLVHTRTPKEDDYHDIFSSLDEELNDGLHEHILGRNLKLEKSESHITKTEICRYYDSPSGCVKGNKCNFAHGEGELRRVKSGTLELKPGSSFINTTRRPQRPTIMDRKIFVGGLPLTVDSDYLKEFFQAEFGPVEDAIVITTKEGRQSRSKGFGFVIFKQVETVASAIETRFVSIFGKKVEIKGVTGHMPVSESHSPSFLQPQLKGNLYGQPLGQLPEHFPPWLVKFKTWFPVFLRQAFKRFGNGEGYPLSSLKADFRATCGMELDHMSIGFLKLSDFIRSFPELCEIGMSSSGNGIASHVVLFPSIFKTHHRLLQSSGHSPSLRAVELPKSPPIPEVSDDGSSSSESKTGEKATSGYAGSGEGDQSSNPWRKLFDSVQWRLKNTGLTDGEHHKLYTKQEGAGGFSQPPPVGGRGAMEATQQSYFSLFQKQWDHYVPIQGLCTVCVSQPGSLAILPCHHNVCLQCFKHNIQTTCIICRVKIQGFQFLEDANLLNTLSDYGYTSPEMGKRQSHGSWYPPVDSP